MTTTLLLVQFAAQNIALACCGLFAGASIYVSLAEYPAMAAGGVKLAGPYLLTAHPRNTIVQSAFAVVGALGGIAAGLAGGTLWWAAGGLLLGVAALVLLGAVMPMTRRFLDTDHERDAPGSERLWTTLRRLHALLGLMSIGALFLFVVKT